jgi:hypothetical protein
MIIEDHISRQQKWSEKTFGPGDRTLCIIDHIRKELIEIAESPDNVYEWVDVILLAIDGAWRSGASPERIATAIENKHKLNEYRKWPDWRTHDMTTAIEHIKE